MRREESLNRGWTFYKEGTAEPVDLPHTWNAPDGTDGGDDYYRGSCYYEREFEAPAREPGEQVYLEFAGVNAQSFVSVNGFAVGTHKGGYSAFRCNITHVLKEKNLLEVVVDNSPSDEIYPQKADFTFYGGIYRDVKLVVVPPVHFAMEDFGGPGVKVTPVLRDGRAEITVEVWLEQGPENGQSRYQLEAVISDEDGEAAMAGTCVESGVTQAPSEQAYGRIETGHETGYGQAIERKPNATLHLTLENPHLWQGIWDPYLYTLTTRLLQEDIPFQEKTSTESQMLPGFHPRLQAPKPTRHLTDQLTLRFGCRSFSVDPDRGFLLNGIPYPLRGVSRHQDREGVGNALTPRMHREDMELIKELGANSIRLAHYQHHQYFYDLCDEYGMVVWAEIPYITCHMDTGRENTLSQMRELIVQNHHHASICFWAVSNEVTVGGVTDQVLENNQALHALCKKLDPGRLTAMACAFMLPDDSPMLQITDLVSYNHYFGWYHGEMEDCDAWFDDFRQKHPGLPMGLSEYGAEAVTKWQTARPQRGDYTEQYQALYHEHMLEMIQKRPWLWCTYVWNMFDFGAHGRDEGGVKGRNNKGLVTFDRKLKKDAFYLYKAYWSKDPFVYIAGRRYVNRAEKETEITVYSNQPQVELYQNGRLTGTQTASHVFRFQVTMEPENVILVKAGEKRDSVILYRVEKPDLSYVLPVQGEVENWFDDLAEIKEGYFSLEDKVGDLVKSPEGLQIFRDFMAVYDSRKKGAAAASHLTEEQRLMTMKSMRLKELMRRTNTPGEEVAQWLEKLQSVHRN